MSLYPRYAIYYVPAHDSALYRWAAELLGYDAYTGDMLPFPAAVLAAAPDWHDLTRDPRKYGFHATLKAPFSLAPNKTEADLLGTVAAFARKLRAIPVMAPNISLIGDFIAILPSERSADLDSLAQDCVVEFDRYRAPLTAVDRARRNPQALTAKQVEHLDRWGYPYVMDEFRFHMTLTGRLSIERRETVLTLLQQLATLDCETIAVDRLTLCRQQRQDSYFQVIAAHDFQSIR